MNTAYFLIFLIGIGAITLLNLAFSAVLFSHFRKIREQSKTFFAGRKGTDLESTILAQMNHIKKLNTETKELYDICEKIHGLAGKGLSRVGYIRFNPFKDVGGDQSFAIALLDGKKNGIVLSSLFTREGTRVYSKPVLEGKPSQRYPFTEEEKHAIESASTQKFTEEAV